MKIGIRALLAMFFPRFITKRIWPMAEDWTQTTFTKRHVDSIVTAIADALIVLDPHGVVCSVNPATNLLLDKTDSELLGIPFEELWGSVRRGKEAHYMAAGLKKLEQADSFTSMEGRLRRRDGEEIPILLSGSVLRNERGERTGFVFVARDIRTLKEVEAEHKQLAILAKAAATATLEKAEALGRANAELERAHVANLNIMDDLARQKSELDHAYKELQFTQAQLLQASKMAALGQVGAGIAHEMNQPLTAVRGFAQLALGDVRENDSLKGDLERIINQVDRISQIVDNIRLFARESKLTPEAFDIHQVIQGALLLVGVQLQEHRIKVLLDFKEGLPHIMGNCTQLQQVFINLLTNSRDALEVKGGGNIWITTRQSSSSHFNPSPTVEVIFRDDGAGISPTDIDRVFDPFFTTKEPGKGTGLGLSISYGIIQSHKGEISLHSTPNEGTTITIHLPTLPLP